MVPMEGVEPTHSYEYQILSLARLPIPPHRLVDHQMRREVNQLHAEFATHFAILARVAKVSAASVELRPQLVERQNFHSSGHEILTRRLKNGLRRTVWIRSSESIG